MSKWLGIAGALVGAGLTSAALALAGPPDIDTYTIIQGSSAALLAGDDPYAGGYAPTAAAAAAFAGNVEVLTYPPGVPLLLAPARALVGDARWGLVAAMLAIVALVAWMARRRPDDPLAAAAPAMAALAPGAAIVGERAWVDPLLALALLVAVVASAAGRGRLAIVAAALALLAKQNAAIALLLLACWRPFGWRRALASLALAAAIALPFLVADPARFVDRLTLVLELPLRGDAINVAGWLAHAELATPALLGALAAVGVALLLALAALLARTGAAASPALALTALAAGQLAVNVFSGHAFYNQHWEVVVLLAAAAAADPRPVAPGEVRPPLSSRGRARRRSGRGAPAGRRCRSRSRAWARARPGPRGAPCPPQTSGA
ncbi:MAG: hypothetical protein H6711_26235 [Myxococcales bacterium]|nr:hypothetical protein [Myxococcales bacterium]